MGKLINRCCYREKDCIFVIHEYENGFSIRIMGEYTEYILNDQASVNEFIQYYNI